MLNQLKIALQYLLPKQALTCFAGWFASKEFVWVTQGAIKLFSRIYAINMDEAAEKNLANYRTFNDFFTRALRDDARMINDDPNWITFPADGTLNESGKIEKDLLLQAKNHHYSLEALLAGNHTMAEQFYDGYFITTYLSPKDYHRVHMPCDATLREMIYVPGSLFSVNFLTASNIPNLFARNERVICYFDTDFGPMVQILVGATIVGSIETVWAGVITPPRQGIIRRWAYPAKDEKNAIILQKGDEMGRFKLGSTVINLFTAEAVESPDHLQLGNTTRVGDPMIHSLITDE